MLTATAAIQDRASLFGWVEASLPENAGYGASVRSQQLGELCSLLVRAIRVSARLPRGLAQAPLAAGGRSGGASRRKPPAEKSNGSSMEAQKAAESQTGLVQTREHSDGDSGKHRKMAEGTSRKTLTCPRAFWSCGFFLGRGPTEGAREGGS